jgi:hypothetical protein
MSSPEVLKPSGEHGVEVSEAAGEQLKKLQEQLEKKAETGGENKGERVESARRETEAVFSREQGREAKRGGEPSMSSVRHATKRQREESFEATMKQIRSEMGAPARTFSKVIHNKTVERVSDAVGNTLARPNAVLAGSTAATFLTLFVFLIAKQYGYRLSGFETIGTFFVGWALGLIYDYARLMFSTRQN